MARETVTVDPVGRTEGHLGITITVDNGEIVEAEAFGPLYRGFEHVMMGRDPREAQDLPTRICGVCPMVHSVCGSKNIEMMLGQTYNNNARLMRNISHALHMIGDHALHFYHLASLDFVTGPDKPPFTPRYEGDYRLPKDKNDRLIKHYLEGLAMRRVSQEAATTFVGKLPHAIAFVPGGVSETPTKENVAEIRTRLKHMKDFTSQKWLPDVETVARYYEDYYKIGGDIKDYLAFGVFELDFEDKDHYHKRGVMMDGKLEKFDMKHLTEDLTHTQQDGKDGLGVWDAETKSANPDKKDSYSFITAANYKGKPVEVGPFTRLLVDQHERFKGTNSSVMGRHEARAVEADELCDAIDKWLDELELGVSGMVEQTDVPDSMESWGLSEAPRGACGHWMKVEDGRIAHWQTMPATNFNGAPRNAKGDPGPFEKALLGTDRKSVV